MKAFLLVLLPLYSFSQIYSEVDSLKKYSYHTFGFFIDKETGKGGVDLFGGTVFFIRKGGKLFLVTANHVYCECDSTGFVRKRMPDYMTVELSKDSTMKTMSVNISSAKANYLCELPWERPDLLAIEITDTVAKNVYSVENLIRPAVKKPGDAVAIGFSGIKNITNTGLRNIQPTSLRFIDNKYSFYTFTDSITNKTDTINYWILQHQFAIDSSLKGRSGSPLFIQDKKSKKWVLYGVFWGYEPNKKDEAIMGFGKIQFAINQINQYLIPKESN